MISNDMRKPNYFSEQFVTALTMSDAEREGYKNMANKLKTWNTQDWLSFIELTSGLLGLIPSPATPFLLGISMGAGVANAKILWDKGDHYTAGLYMAFSVLPASTLIKSLRNSKLFMRLGQKNSLKLIEKVGEGTATAAEKEMVQQLTKDAATVAKTLEKEVTKQIIGNILSELPKKSLMFIINILRGMVKLGVFGITQGIIIEGTFYTYDKIYKALNYKNEKFLSEREKSEAFQLFNIIKEKEPEVKKSAIGVVKGAEDKILQNSELFATIDTAGYKSYLRNRK